MDDDIQDFCQLTEDEIEEELQRRAERREADRKALVELERKQRSFRFVGGML